MSLFIPFSKDVYEIAKKYYDEKTFDHAYRVSVYAIGIAGHFELSNIEYQLVNDIALLHDLLEDTNYKIEEHSGDFYKETMWNAVQLLTKNDNDSYEDYLLRLKINKYAYIVKLADMKDHLNLKDTLTEKLKKKYLNGLAVLL